jgi:hypothetical protein
MRGWAFPAGLALLCLALAVTPAHATDSISVTFFGYQQLSGRMVFQVIAGNADPQAQAAPLYPTGARVNFGPYRVGAFHQAVLSAVDSVTRQKVMVDVSTLELINVNTGKKIELTLRRPVKLDASLNTIQTRNEAKPQRPRLA